MSSQVQGQGEILRVKPRGTAYGPDAILELHPGRGGYIKDEPDTVIWRETLPDGTDAAIKLYRRGLGRWIASRLSVFRAAHEFDGLSQLEALGVPCSRPLFWCHGSFGSHGWGDLLATGWVPGSRPLSEVFASDTGVGASMDLSPIFEAVGRMHGAGLRHGTLVWRNIMVQGVPPRVAFVFIDMPRFHRFPSNIRGTRMARYDLLCLCECLAQHFPESAVQTWLTAYGMSPSEQSVFRAFMTGFRNTSFVRRVIGAEFNLRYLASRIF